MKHHRQVLLLLLGFFASCQTRPNLTREGVAPKLSKDDWIYVAVPADGRFESTVYARSGIMTGDALTEALEKHSGKVERGHTAEGRDAALRSAKVSSRTWCIVPTILHWEDRATEWSGLRDAIEVQLKLIEVTSGETRETTTINSKSSWATFGGDHPQDLLKKPMALYVASLFGEEPYVEKPDPQRDSEY